MDEIEEGNILEGPFWPEKVKVISAKSVGEDQKRVEAVGLESRKYYNPVLSSEDLRKVIIKVEDELTFSGDGERMFLHIESHRIRNAFQFDPHYAVNVSQIDPLPHQIEAVYHYIMPNPRIRFLLADDPGAGKTIMAGLLLKELKYRGLVDRTLIVVPGHLKFQWLREMKDRFQENFMVVDRGVLDAVWPKNILLEVNQAIVSMDFAKQEHIVSALKDCTWDLCIVDEAHKMSAYKYGEKITKTQRYNLGEVLSPLTSYLLFLTATPHRGDPENFRLLLDLLEPGFFASSAMLSRSVQDSDNPLFVRRLKEDMKKFDSSPIFPPRNVETVKFFLSEDEKKLYNAVTEYVQNHFNKALAKDKRNVTFALTILQRRLASSTRAVRKSLERRFQRLKDLHEKGQLIQDIGYDEEYLEDLEENDRWRKEEELLEKLTSAETLEELKEELDRLEALVRLARDVEKKEVETKLIELKKVMDVEKLHGSDIKILIFTESKDTLFYLGEKIKKWGFSTTFIHGGMNMDSRLNAEAEFRNKAQVLVSTEAGGEGINLQFCWIMVNYDIPWNPNRLEQRMGRIHRYGQEHEVHIYNLVAVDTREGRILDRLFQKLAHIREHLGSDRVFDVIGEVLVGRNLKDLILDAIANRRTMDDILKDFERIPDEEAMNMVKEASSEALATRHIDMSRILGEQRKAKENRLVPEYVEGFFKKAAEKLNIGMREREEGIWQIAPVPFEIRNQPNMFKAKYGEVLREYRGISFVKEIASKKQAEFVAMGHPLLESVVDTVLSLYGQDSLEGATFLDPEGKLDGIVWFLEGEIRDGKNEIAGRKLYAVHQRSDNEESLSIVNPAVLWDLKPLAPGKKRSHQFSQISYDRDEVVSYVIREGLEEDRREYLNGRQKDAEVKEKYGLKSLESMILGSDARISEYETRRIKGENIPEATIQNEVRKKEDLVRKKDRLSRDIEAEVHLYPIEPRIIGVARVVCGKLRRGMKANSEIEDIGMRITIEYEERQGRKAEDVHNLNLGYDVRSQDSGGKFRYIEVKARAGEGHIVLTPNEWLMAHRLEDEYWLYIVANSATNPELHIIRNPVTHLKPDEEVSIVRYVVKDWKSKAEVAE